MRSIVLLLALLALPVNAHEMTPAYPVLKPSIVDDVSYTKLKLYNRREDINYYAISVYTGDWKPVPFATQQRLIKIKHNKSTFFEVYLRNSDIDRAVYICTESKTEKVTEQLTFISSRICSKIKQK